MALPTLTTDRLLLRERRLEDIPAYLEMDGDAEVMRYVGDGAVPNPVAHAVRMRQRIAAGSGNGVWVWSVFERERPTEFLGCTLLSPEPKLNLIELAYRFRRNAWGRGFATEAGRACLDYGFGALGLQEIAALAYPENRRSQRVLEKLGFMPMGRHEAFGKALLLYRQARPVATRGRQVIDNGL
jgi:RimJ/RimL family protein N-acetyltransferase